MKQRPCLCLNKLQFNALAFAPFRAKLGPLQVTMARFYGVRVLDTGIGYGLF